MRLTINFVSGSAMLQYLIFLSFSSNLLLASGNTGEQKNGLTLSPHHTSQIGGNKYFKNALHFPPRPLSEMSTSRPIIGFKIREEILSRTKREDYERYPGGSNWQKADLQSATRINSPRNDDRTDRNNVDLQIPSNVGNTRTKKPSYISVKLPDDIQQHLGQNYGQDKRTILGIPVEHLADHDTVENINESQNVNKKGNHESQQIETTTISTYIQYNPHDEEGDEYYNKNELLPKITKEIPNSESDMKSPEQYPIDKSRERNIWSLAWQAHIYFSGTLFILLAIYCTVNVCRLHTFSRLFSRGYFLSLNIFMILVGVSRGVFLFVDAYNTKLTLPYSIAYILLDIGYPCISSAFAVLFLALLRVTQVELLSPSVQTPYILAIFCGVHIFISLTLDVTVGLVVSLQYILLLGHGIFIVWSLLLSAGYFYIYSMLNKVVSRNYSDGTRSMYPKLMFDPIGSGNYSMRVPLSQSNPLSRAVHLTLGVAVLGSLMGGVQLYGMIGMHGLLHADSEVDRRYPAWYGYQVVLRILEVMICYLLAVVATTPLPQGSTNGSPRSSGGLCSSCSPLLCCNGDMACNGCQENNPTQLDEDIYTEICSNNQSVHALNSSHSGCYNQATLMNPGNNQQNLVMSASGQQITNTLGRNYVPLVIQNTETCQYQTSENNAINPDMALYTNMRSRPSSMLFNDSGFVRFCIGEDPHLAQEEILHQSMNNLDSIVQESDRLEQGRESRLEQGRQSRMEQGSTLPIRTPVHEGSIDDSCRNKSEMCSPDKPDIANLPGLPKYPAAVPHTNEPLSSPIYNPEGIDSLDDQRETYEAPAGLIIPDQKILAQTKGTIGYSESDLSSVDPLYAGEWLYGYGKTPSIAPSCCSSISATQSFDMRVYGRMGAATLGRPTEKPKPKLENKFYYYGSTQRQKKSFQASSSRESLRPRPLLPSQRNLSDTKTVQGSPTPQRVSVGPVSQPVSQTGQSLYDQIKSHKYGVMSPTQTNTNFQRSRSLGHHYQRDPSFQNVQQTKFMGMKPPKPTGPRTPQSVARRVLDSVTKRQNRDKFSKNNQGATRHYAGQYPNEEMIMTTPGTLMQTPDGQLVDVARQISVGHFINSNEGFVQIQGPLVHTRDGQQILVRDGQQMVSRPTMLVRQVSLNQEDLYSQSPNYDDPNMYKREREQVQTYGRLPYGTRIQGRIRQVLGTPPTNRHDIQANTKSGVFNEQLDSRDMHENMFQDKTPTRLAGHQQEVRIMGQKQDQQAARLAGQHFLASPPDMPRQASSYSLGCKDKQNMYDEGDSNIQSSLDQCSSQISQYYNDGLADSELDSEVSTLFEARQQPGAQLKNIHLMSPLEYAAMLKQYTEPCTLLGQDVTPDSGVVMDSRQNSKERDAQTFNCQSLKPHIDSLNESSDTSESSSPQNEGMLARNRYKLVPTQDDEMYISETKLENDQEINLNNYLKSEDETKVSSREDYEKIRNKKQNCPAFEWDGSKLVPLDPQTVKKHLQSGLIDQTDKGGLSDSEALSESCTEYSMGCLLSENEQDNVNSDSENPQQEKIANVCSEIEARFNHEIVSTDEETT